MWHAYFLSTETIHEIFVYMCTCIWYRQIWYMWYKDIISPCLIKNLLEMSAWRWNNFILATNQIDESIKIRSTTRRSTCLLSYRKSICSGNWVKWDSAVLNLGPLIHLFSILLAPIQCSGKMAHQKLRGKSRERRDNLLPKCLS